MKITLFQQDIVWCDPDANYKKVEEVLKASPDTDLMVMPEMFTTGFVTLPEEGQLEMDASVTMRLKQLAAAYDCAIAGSVAVSEDGGVRRNRGYFITPEGAVYVADKHHLFRPGQEHRGYKAGEHRTVIEYRGVRFLLTVCYDLRFPVWSRNTRSSLYDVMICVANWPQPRQNAWEILLSARAVENQAYVIGVNRVGHDKVCNYLGGTRAVHPYGHLMASCKDGVEMTCSFEPDMEWLQHYREKFPCLADADEFVIQN